MGPESRIRPLGCDTGPFEIIGIWYLIDFGNNRKVLVNRKHLKMLDREVRQKLRYGSCCETFRMITPIDSEYRDVEGLLGSYTVCNG